MSTWVFLRGLMREARHWGSFPAVFHDFVPDARVLTLDLPGNGSLHDRASPLRVEDMAEYCRSSLSAQGLAPPYQVLALSLGAMVAVAWSARYPEEVTAGVLINTSLRPFSPFFRRLRPGNYPALLALMLAPRDAERQERRILRLTSCHGAAQPDVLAAWSEYARQYPVRRRNALRQMLAAVRYRAPARNPLRNLLLLAAAQDRLVDARCSQRLADGWHVPLAVHPDAGHDLPLDDGAWVARQVRDWLAAIPQPAVTSADVAARPARRNKSGDSSVMRP